MLISARGFWVFKVLKFIELLFLFVIFFYIYGSTESYFIILSMLEDLIIFSHYIFLELKTPLFPFIKPFSSMKRIKLLQLEDNLRQLTV